MLTAFQHCKVHLPQLYPFTDPVAYNVKQSTEDYGAAHQPDFQVSAKQNKSADLVVRQG